MKTNDLEQVHHVQFDYRLCTDFSFLELKTPPLSIRIMQYINSNENIYMKDLKRDNMEPLISNYSISEKKKKESFLKQCYSFIKLYKKTHPTYLLTRIHR